MFSLALPLLALLGVVVAMPDHFWKALEPHDLRSPCPGLNMLATHGYLPRNGKGLTGSMILGAASAVYNVAPEVLNVAVHIGLLTSAQVELSLSMISNFTIQLNMILLSPAPTLPWMTIFISTRRFSKLWSNRTPELTTTMLHLESALYLNVMGNPATGVAQKEFVNTFFREERLL
ncbi:Chloroperoxidase [Mycena floridula]|nr:Chloroperoxidase [Mycena floridula]